MLLLFQGDGGTVAKKVWCQRRNGILLMVVVSNESSGEDAVFSIQDYWSIFELSECVLIGYVHLVSTYVHLTKLMQANWVISLWIMNEFKKFSFKICLWKTVSLVLKMLNPCLLWQFQVKWILYWKSLIWTLLFISESGFLNAFVTTAWWDKSLLWTRGLTDLCHLS